MVARATGSTTISFGLVSIPVKIYTATQSQAVSFNTLHADCGTRIKQRLYCPTHDAMVEREATVKGFEVAKDQYVTFGEEELRLLEAQRTNTIDITEFVPEASVDFTQIQKTQYLGPDKGGHKAYGLLSKAMHNTGLVAIGRYNARGKSHVVMLRPYGRGLLLHQLYYADEVRAFDDVELGDEVTTSEAELRLAEQLIHQLKSDAFDPSRYRDDYSDRVREAAEKKAQGMEVVASPAQPTAQIVDLFEALKRSLDTAPKASEDAAAAEPSAPLKGPKKAEPQQPRGRRKAAGEKK